MNIFLRPQKVCQACGQVWYPADDTDTAHCPNCGSTSVSNEKFSLYVTVLFYFIGLIVLVLILINWKEVEIAPMIEPVKEVAETLTQSEQQVQLPSIEEELDINAEPALISPPQKTVLKDPPKKPALAAENIPAAAPVPETLPEQTQEVAPVPAPVEETRISHDTVAFSLWSISELRLRKVYTKLMNDGSIGTELRKKEYLQFVNSRNKRCGELQAQYAININSVG